MAWSKRGALCRETSRISEVVTRRKPQVRGYFACSAYRVFLTGGQEVAGSNPASPTNKTPAYAGVSLRYDSKETALGDHSGARRGRDKII